MSIPKMMHAEEMQNDAQGFNRQEAIDQRDWTERMSNTQYQRAASDASAAGLNRILAMRQGGNTAGGGATASSGSSPASLPGTGFNQTIMNSAVRAEAVAKTQLAWNYSADTQLKKDQDSLVHEQIETQKQLTERTRHEADMASNSAKGRALEGEIDTTTYGKILRYIDRSIRAITGTSSAYGRFKNE